MNQLKQGLRITSALFAAVVVAAIGLVPSSVAAAPTPLDLTIGSQSAQSADVITYVAMGLGLFQKAGLNLHWAYNATSAPSLLVSGQAQLLSDRPSNAASLVDQGQNIKVLSPNITDQDPGLVGSTGVQSLQDLISRGSNCTVAIGTSGLLYQFTLGWIQKFGIKCNVVTLGAYQTLGAAGLVAGTYSAGAEILPIGAPILAQCSGCHWLIDPSDPNYFKNGYDLGQHFMNNCFYTTADDLAKYKDAITRYFQVLKQAARIVRGMEPDAVAAAVQASGISAWQSQKLGDIEATTTGLGALPGNAWQDAVDFSHITNGAVPPELWTQTLIAAAQQGVSINPTDSKYSYANMVDTSIAHSVFGYNTTKYVSINSKGSYSSKHLGARHGSFTLLVKNGSTVAHGVEIVQKGHGLIGKAAPVATGNYATVTVNLPKGSFYFVDTNAKGVATTMKGTLTIT